MVVIGIDVGMRVCGYVVCSVRNCDIEVLKEGQIKPQSSKNFPEKLGQIFEGLEKEIASYKPQVLIAEKLYSHYRHPTTLGVLSNIKGVVALLAYQKGIELFEYSPTRARKSFIGRGSADSFRVKKFAETLTGKVFQSEHTADAFSLVAAFSHEQKFSKLKKAALP